MSSTGGGLQPKTKRGGLQHAKTLYEDESGWGITKYKGYTQAAMTHKCKNSEGSASADERLNLTQQYHTTNIHLTGNLSGKHRCSCCRAEAPDHIITLWTLFNWDKM